MDSLAVVPVPGFDGSKLRFQSGVFRFQFRTAGGLDLLIHLRVAQSLVRCAADERNQQAADGGIFAIEIIVSLDARNGTEGYSALIGKRLVCPSQILLALAAPLHQNRERKQH